MYDSNVFWNYSQNHFIQLGCKRIWNAPEYKEDGEADDNNGFV